MPKRNVLAALVGVSALALIWLLMCVYLWAFQERMIFYPRPLDPASEQIAQHALSVQADDGTTISGWALPNPDAPKALLYFGGNAMEISSALINHSEHLNLAVAGFNYRGYGASQGVPNEEQLRIDALQAFDVAQEKLGVAPRDWIIVGRSLGSHMAAYVAANRDVGAVALITPFDSIEAIAKKRYRVFPIRMLIRHPFNTVELTGKISEPVLILRAESDWTVPAWSTDSLVENWKSDASLEQVTIAGSGHNDIDNHEQYWQDLREFVARGRP